MSDTAVTFDDIKTAARRIAPFASRTPLLWSSTLNASVGAQVSFKCENLQKIGAFKFRGALNAVMSLDDARAKPGVATHSSGNHGAALALAARLRGIPAFVVMPENAPQPKREAVRAYGGEIVTCAPGLKAREATLATLIEERGLEVVHPYDDARVIAGQGTCALEILEEMPDVDVILVPVGGGGLISGTAIAVNGIRPEIRVIGAEPALADDAWQALETGERVVLDNPDTVADGLRASLGELNFAIIREHVESIVRVEEAAIVEAMKYAFSRLKLVIEPSSAVPVAVVLKGLVDLHGLKAVVVLTGGNVDLDHLPWVTR